MARSRPRPQPQQRQQQQIQQRMAPQPAAQPRVQQPQVRQATQNGRAMGQSNLGNEYWRDGIPGNNPNNRMGTMPVLEGGPWRPSPGPARPGPMPTRGGGGQPPPQGHWNDGIRGNNPNNLGNEYWRDGIPGNNPNGQGRAAPAPAPQPAPQPNIPTGWGGVNGGPYMPQPMPQPQPALQPEEPQAQQPDWRGQNPNIVRQAPAPNGGGGTAWAESQALQPAGDYWTQERMQNAQPLPWPTEDRMGVQGAPVDSRYWDVLPERRQPQDQVWRGEPPGFPGAQAQRDRDLGRDGGRAGGRNSGGGWTPSSQQAAGRAGDPGWQQQEASRAAAAGVGRQGPGGAGGNNPNQNPQGPGPGGGGPGSRDDQLLPYSPELEEMRRGMDKELGNELAAIGIQRDQIPAMVNWVRQRMQNDRQMSQYGINEAMNERGLMSSSINNDRQLQDQNQHLNRWNEFESEVTGQYAQLGERENQMKRDYNDRMIEMQMQLANQFAQDPRTAVDQSNVDYYDPGGGSQPYFADEPYGYYEDAGDIPRQTIPKKPTKKNPPKTPRENGPGSKFKNPNSSKSKAPGATPMSKRRGSKQKASKRRGRG